MKKDPNNHLGHFERVRENVIKYDVSSLDDILVLEMILQGVLRRADTNEIAHNLLQKYKTFKNLYNYATIQDLENIKGIGPSISKKLIALLKTYQYATQNPNTVVNKDYFISFEHIKVQFGEFEEKLVAFILNKRDEIIQTTTLAVGDETHVSVDLKVLLDKVRLSKGCGVILAHNHIGDNFFPSIEDIQFTARAYEILEKHNIKFITLLIERVIT